MQEIIGDLFESKLADAICILTNGHVNAHGESTMGKGCALGAKQRWPGIQMAVGTVIQGFDNTLVQLTFEEQGQVFLQACKQPAYPRYDVPYHIIMFPTKHHWRDPSDLKLIERSATQLMTLTDQLGWKSVVLPRPGCGAGQLSWDEVRPVLANILDQRIYVITFK